MTPRWLAPTALTASEVRDLLADAIVWRHSGDGEFPYVVRHENLDLTIRVNDFPAEPLYTLIANGSAAADLEDWPTRWVRPPMPQHLIDLVTKRGSDK